MICGVANGAATGLGPDHYTYYLRVDKTSPALFPIGGCQAAEDAHKVKHTWYVYLSYVQVESAIGARRIRIITKSYMLDMTKSSCRHLFVFIWYLSSCPGQLLKYKIKTKRCLQEVGQRAHLLV